MKRELFSFEHSSSDQFFANAYYVAVNCADIFFLIFPSQLTYMIYFMFSGFITMNFPSCSNLSIMPSTQAKVVADTYYGLL